MSELIQQNDNSATIRWKLLTGVSALALTAYISSAGLARAEDASQPQLWIELGGELDQFSGFAGSFTAPFMTAISPTPGPYRGNAFDQTPQHYAFGLDGKITFQPEGSDWIFSAGIRIGRSDGKRKIHHASAVPTFHWTNVNAKYPSYSYSGTAAFTHKKLADTKSRHSEKHAILDFTAGKDVGIGLLGQGGTSTINAGVRFAQFSVKSNVEAYGRPTVIATYPTKYKAYPYSAFHEYTMYAHATRSFKGVGPSLSWNGSAALAGNTEDGELTLDFGLNAAILFGKQKAKTDQATRATRLYHKVFGTTFYGMLYSSTAPGHHHHNTRSRSVTVPNVGGFAGISYRYTDAKLSIGYRYDTFLSAMDTGIDAAKKSNVTFNGPYASISIGIGD